MNGHSAERHFVAMDDRDKIFRCIPPKFQGLNRIYIGVICTMHNNAVFGSICRSATENVVLHFC